MRGAATFCLMCFSGVGVSSGQGLVVTVTFDGPPAVAVGSAVSVSNYQELGFNFQSINAGGSVGRVGSSPRYFRPDNGTAYLQAAFTQSLMFSRLDGGTFDFISVDLAEYSTVVPDAVTVQFIGYFAGGGTITTTLTTDGIIDGTGPLADFQTFYFQGWNDLIRVEIPTYGWSLDNVVVGGVPEPSTFALVLLGGGLFWLARRKRCPKLDG